MGAQIAAHLANADVPVVLFDLPAKEGPKNGIVTKALDGLTGANEDQTRGIDIVRKSLTALVRQIAANAGHDGAVVSGKLLDQTDTSFGFNASTDTYENLVAAGVIDPTKVVRTALQNAASVSGLLITTEATIAELPEDKSAAPAMPGGMGGMGGMDF